MDLEKLVVTNGSLLESHDDELVQNGNVVKDNGNLSIVEQNKNLNVDFLVQDLESYWDDINDRLTISRMVNDSVIRGMVNAVEQEAAEKIAQKESEVSRLKETLHLYHVGADETGPSESHLIHNEVYLSVQDAFLEHESIKESLSNLDTTVKNQYKMLMEEIDNIKGFNSVKGAHSNGEILGLGGILQENVSEKRTGVDKMLDDFKSSIGTAFKQMNDAVYLSKGSLSLWQQEHDFQAEVAHAVIGNFVRSLKEEFEQHLWEQNAQYGKVSLEKIKEISALRQELDSIFKSVFSHENGQSMSHACVEAGEERIPKRVDPLHRKVSGSISSSSLWEANGKHEESVTSTSDNLDALKHMSHDELIHHFKTEMNKMKRDHDYRMQEMTEDYFSLKREYLKLKERSSFLPLKKDKESDALKKKIPEVISKLDKILLENEKVATLDNNDAILLLENHQLRDMLSEKKMEATCLFSQVADAAEKIKQLSHTEANLLEVIRNLESDVVDSHIEASISGNVYASIFTELMDQIKCINEESDLEGRMMQEVYEFVFRDASKRVHGNEDAFEDSCIESSIMHDLFKIIYGEALKEAEEELCCLHMKYTSENVTRILLERNLLEREDALKLEMEEKERLKHEILSLKGLVEDKEKQLRKVEEASAKETEKLGLASQELSNLRNLTSQQERTLLENNDELKLVNVKLVEALDKIKRNEVEIHELKQKLQLAREQLKKTNDEKTMLLTVIQEKQHKLSEVEAEEKEHRKLIKSLVVSFSGLTKEFTNLGNRVAEHMQESNARLKNLHGQLYHLAEQVDRLKAARLMYKQQLERKCSDLQKAETEVDLLGDEVDTLVKLLERIYIALDHYSPVLKHYPGIIEILKLVRRELSGESRRLV